MADLTRQVIGINYSPVLQVYGAGPRLAWAGANQRENALMKLIMVVAGALLVSVGAVVAQQDTVKSRTAQMKATGKALGGTLGSDEQG